jgi:SAM-dependent methyltransferase
LDEVDLESTPIRRIHGSKLPWLVEFAIARNAGSKKIVMAGARKDNWSAGDLYEPYVGRWSRLVARDFLAWLGVGAQRNWLDVGCGTGALAETIFRQAQPRRLQCIDLSGAFIAHAKARLGDVGAAFAVADAQALPLCTARFDAAVSALVLNFVPRPDRAVGEMARTVRSGGIIAAYVWDYAEKMELMRYFWDAAAALDPAAAALDEGVRFPLCQPAALLDLFRAAGLTRAEARCIDVPTRFRDFDDYWSPFLGGQGPAPGYAMSLSEDRRTALREKIRAALPIAGDGSIDLSARAWAVRGRVA